MMQDTIIDLGKVAFRASDIFKVELDYTVSSYMTSEPSGITVHTCTAEGTISKHPVALPGNARKVYQNILPALGKVVSVND